jgi:hypothetical protein
MASPERQTDERGPVNVGVTATQDGLTPEQKARFEEILAELRAKYQRIWVHHGDCEGGDKQIDAIARKVGCGVVIHPPKDPKKRAFCAQSHDVVWEPQDYMVRNQDIVDESDLMLSGPKTFVCPTNLRGQGTWSTTKRAEKAKKPLTIILPDGRTRGTVTV